MMRTNLHRLCAYDEDVILPHLLLLHVPTRSNKLRRSKREGSANGAVVGSSGCHSVLVRAFLILQWYMTVKSYIDRSTLRRCQRFLKLLQIWLQSHITVHNMRKCTLGKQIYPIISS